MRRAREKALPLPCNSVGQRSPCGVRRNRRRRNLCALLILLLASPVIANVEYATRWRKDAVTAVDNLHSGIATLRDRHGRMRAPVFINGRGPFSLIVDTGANGSAVAAGVVDALGLSPDESPQVILRGVTGSSRAASVTVDSLALG